MTVPPPFPNIAIPAASTKNVTAQVRLLCTTDLHAHLLPYDYFADQDDRPHGLARIATLIRTARAEAQNVFLFDNGDALQGTPIGDMTPQDGSDWHGPHPVISAMNHLRYDAATLGNHEFNFGIDWLCRAISEAKFPFTCANVRKGGCTLDRDGNPFLPPYLLLKQQVLDDSGGRHLVTLGIIGLVPIQVNTWDRIHLQDRVQAHDMVESAQRIVPQVRAEGADIVILLAHTGIDTDPAYPMMENAALPLAALPGVDAIITGHCHGIFPQRHAVPPHHQHPLVSGVDHARGRLNGTPALMAGAFGSHLGVMDLNLRRDGDTWALTRVQSELRPTAPQGRAPVPADPTLMAQLAPAHQATLRLTQRPIGHATTRLHSYLALASPNKSVEVINALQQQCLAQAVAGTADGELPLVSAACAVKTGGLGGPGNYTNVPAGPLCLRHAADLYPFPNVLCGLRVTGADLRDWLERAAICFAQVTPGAQDAPLLDPHVPGHDFDVIHGLSYVIDLSQPARFDRAGRLVNPDARRISDLSHAGKPVRDNARFLLATNNYRASGGGPYRTMPDSAVVYTSPRTMRDLLISHLATTPLEPPENTDETWRFAPLPGTTVILETAPDVVNDPSALRAARATPLGQNSDGFIRLRISL